MKRRALLTAQEVAGEFGLPSVSAVRTMRANGLRFIAGVSKSFLYDPADVEAFLESAKTCHDHHAEPTLNITHRENASTSTGMKAHPSKSVQQAQAMAAKLKKCSPRSLASVTPIGRDRTNI